MNDDSITEAAIEAGAIAWFDRVQAERLDPGAKDESGKRWTWESVNESDRRSYRALARPVVLAALSEVRPEVVAPEEER